MGKPPQGKDAIHKKILFSKIYGESRCNMTRLQHSPDIFSHLKKGIELIKKKLNKNLINVPERKRKKCLYLNHVGLVTPFVD